MSTNVQLSCPVCGREITATVTTEGGDWVPYGSTNVQTPEYLVAEIDNCSGGCMWTDRQLEHLDEQACELSVEYDSEPETQFDTLEEKEDYYRD